MNSGISGSLTSSLGCGPRSSALIGGPWDDKEDLVVAVGAPETVLVGGALEAVAVMGTLETLVAVGARETAAAPKVEAAASED